MGLIGRDGQWHARPEWTALEWSSACGAFVARRDGRVGLVDAKGRVSVEPHYAEVAPLTDGERAEMLDALGAIRHIVRRDDGRCAIVDGQGRVLTPFDFVNMGALTWLPDDEAVPGELFTRYAIGVLPGEPGQLAICDLKTGGTVAQGRYDDVAGLFWGRSRLAGLRAGRGRQRRAGDGAARGRHRAASGALRGSATMRCSTTIATTMHGM